MAGMRKAARRRLTRYKLPEQFFEEGEVVVSAVAVDGEGTPTLMLGMVDCFHERGGALEEAVRFELIVGETVFALDAVFAEGERRRLVTETEGSPVQAILELSLSSPTLTFLLMDVTNGAETYSVQREHVARRARNSDILQEPFVIGEGEFCATTINRWNGAVYVQRFGTEDEALTQIEQNIAEDAPFGGLVVN